MDGALHCQETCNQGTFYCSKLASSPISEGALPGPTARRRAQLGCVRERERRGGHAARDARDAVERPAQAGLSRVALNNDKTKTDIVLNPAIKFCLELLYYSYEQTLAPTASEDVASSLFSYANACQLRAETSSIHSAQPRFTSAATQRRFPVLVQADAFAHRSITKG